MTPGEWRRQEDCPRALRTITMERMRRKLAIMKHRQLASTLLGAMLAVMTLTSISLVGAVGVPRAEAVPSMSDVRRKMQNNERLKQQLAGVNSDLADQILALNDLNDNQIPAAQKSYQEAQQSAEQASSVAQSTADRLEAARKDKAELEEKIKQSGEDYDDAKAGVAEMARKGFHGSDASMVMEVVTKSTSTKDFVDKMQADAAVSRSEANAANDAAGDLNSSMNRKERLAAIEDQIDRLKTQADQDAATALSAAKQAQGKQKNLEDLRDKGTAQRAKLERQKNSLTSQTAREAAEIIIMESQIDALAQEQKVQQAAHANPVTGDRQQIGKPTPPPTSGGGNGGSGPVPPPNGGNGVSGMNYGVPGNCPEGSGYCYGHPTGNSVGGSAYPARQCTLWAYIRRSQLSLPVGSYMGNGADWAGTARSLGYLVNNTPHVGAVMVFARGQRVGSWNASPAYGHVAVVERVNSDGSVLISEGGTGFATFPAWETVYNAGAYQYVHY